MTIAKSYSPFCISDSTSTSKKTGEVQSRRKPDQARRISRTFVFESRIPAFIICATDSSDLTIDEWWIRKSYQSPRIRPRLISAWTREKITGGSRESTRVVARGTQDEKSQFALARTARVARTIRNVPDQTFKSHFNEKGKSRITASPLPDDGAVPGARGGRTG